MTYSGAAERCPSHRSSRVGLTSATLCRAFDDPVRTHPPVASAKRRVEEVNEEPSKQGLGEIYESEYKKQVGAGRPVGNMQHAIEATRRVRSVVAQWRTG